MIWGFSPYFWKHAFLESSTPVLTEPRPWNIFSSISVRQPDCSTACASLSLVVCRKIKCNVSICFRPFEDEPDFHRFVRNIYNSSSLMYCQLQGLFSFAKSVCSFKWWRALMQSNTCCKGAHECVNVSLSQKGVSKSSQRGSTQRNNGDRRTAWPTTSLQSLGKWSMVSL